MIAALFVRRDSYYKVLPGVDCYDEDRDALTWPGGCPAIFHPPCRAWGKLKGFAKPNIWEKDLARWSIAMCRRFGGVLEHPVNSDLWRESGCATPGIRDNYGGVLVTLNQGDFGHPAPKATGLYLVNIDPPPLPWLTAPAPGRVELLTRSAREHTPKHLASLLVHLARCAS